MAGRRRAWPGGAALDAASQGVETSRPAGGVSLWIRLPPPAARGDALTIAAKPRETAMTLAPGPLFTAGDRFRGALRPSVPLVKTTVRAPPRWRRQE